MGKIRQINHQRNFTHLHGVPKHVPRNKRVITVNSWKELILRTTKVILSFSTQFQRHCSVNKRGIRVNPWVELVQSTTKVILHISTEFQGHSSGKKELVE